MLHSNPIQDWQRFGNENPYFGVLSQPALKGSKLDTEALKNFYISGVHHVEGLLEIAKAHFGFVPHGRAIDFGCGVGRLSSAMAPLFDEVVGIDISPGMLREARSYARSNHLANIRYENPEDGYEIPSDAFDFVHTYLVLQHMPVAAGEKAIGALVRALRTGGVGAIHFTYGHVRGRLYHALRELPKRNILTRAAGNLILGRKWNAPAMMMSAYSIERVLAILADDGIERSLVYRVDDWGNLGAFVIFRKDAAAAAPWSNPAPR